MSEGNFTRFAETSFSTTAPPKPSMSIQSREAKCSSARFILSGQKKLGQRQTAWPWSRTSFVLHTGQYSGNLKGCEFAPRKFLSTTSITAGIISPAFSIKTLSPSRMSFLASSSALCSVALETVLPERNTLSSSATGVIAPVLPTCKVIFFKVVIALWLLYFHAVAQRGDFAVKPAFCHKEQSLSFITAPSVSNGNFALISSSCIIAW